MTNVVTALNSENEIIVTVNPGKRAHSALIKFYPRDKKSFKMTVITDDAMRDFVVVVDNSKEQDQP